MEEMKNAHKMCWKTWREETTWETGENVKGIKMNPKEAVYKDVNWIKLSQDRFNGRSL